MKLDALSFSPQIQAFYGPSLDYPELPSDLIEVTEEQHLKLLNAINAGCIIFGDLSLSTPKPSLFHKWDGSNWIDSRTQEEQLAYKRTMIPKITKRQFWLTMYDHQMKVQVEALFQSDERAKIEFESVDKIERLSPTVLAMEAVLGLSTVRIDELWDYALTL